MNDPWLLILMTAAGLYVAKLWREDYRASLRGETRRGMLPGVTPARTRAMTIAISGAVALLVLETAGEQLLGLASQQTRMTWWLACYSILAAPVIEEVVFRGWLVIEHRGRAVMWLGAIVASIVFALVHPFLWQWEDGQVALSLTSKAWFSTAVLFATSLWLYVARLARWNPQRSLLPCFAAHAVKNAGVVAIKAMTGFMDGLS